MNNYLVEELREKLRKHQDSSCIIMTIGDLRDVIPELMSELNTTQKLESDPEKPKFISPVHKEEKVVGDDEGIIPLFELEERLIKASLTKTNGNVEQASKEMRISSRTMRRKLEAHNINYKNFKK